MEDLAHSRQSPESPIPFGDFLNPGWDRSPRPAIQMALLELFREQALFASRNTSFWRERLPEGLVTRPRLSRQDIESIPILTKSDLRLLHSDDLLPEPFRPFHVVRGTGGTTGAPVHIFWTWEEWQAATEAIVRYLSRLEHIRPLRVWNGYNQAHAAGPSFDDAVRLLGGTPLTRHFRCTDAQAVEEIGRLSANVLVLPPKSGSDKGGGLQDLLAVDPNFLRRFSIRGLLLSSCAADEELLEEVCQEGVEVVINLYGSTEIFPTAVSCEASPNSLHLSQGHVFVEVVDESGRHVRSGQKGRVVVSRIGARAARGIGVARGTQLLRLAVGDWATYVDEPCPCGRSSPRLLGIERVSYKDEKLEGGCERWD